ncbi:MAG: thioredoxin family protein [Bacteroidales bacterium]|jgi:thioredoxin-like negative regulator of GroEL|nr:thioredoxin family protein [Bacteroidales bacterium]
MIKNITSLDQLATARNQKGCLVYFSHDKCNVCKVLKPKVHQLLNEYFPHLEMYYCDTEHYPQIAAQNSIFTVPTLIIFFDGKEFFRKSRNIGLEELKNELKRPYSLMFE